MQIQCNGIKNVCFDGWKLVRSDASPRVLQCFTIRGQSDLQSRWSGVKKSLFGGRYFFAFFFMRLQGSWIYSNLHSSVPESTIYKGGNPRTALNVKKKDGVILWPGSGLDSTPCNCKTRCGSSIGSAAKTCSVGSAPQWTDRRLAMPTKVSSAFLFRYHH